MKTLFTIGEVAKMLSKPRYMISYLFEQSILEEPNRVGNKRVFTEQDINKIQDYFERRFEKQSAKSSTK